MKRTVTTALLACLSALALIVSASAYSPTPRVVANTRVICGTPGHYTATSKPRTCVLHQRGKPTITLTKAGFSAHRWGKKWTQGEATARLRVKISQHGFGYRSAYLGLELSRLVNCPGTKVRIYTRLKYQPPASVHTGLKLPPWVARILPSCSKVRFAAKDKGTPDPVTLEDDAPDPNPDGSDLGALPPDPSPGAPEELVLP